MQTLLTRARRYPLPTFILAVYALAWAIWLPALLASRGWLSLSLPSWFVLMGGLSTVVASLGVTGLTSGRAGLRHLLGRVVRWRFPIHWYAVALLVPPGLTLASVLIYGAFTGADPGPDWRALPMALARALALTPLALAEEIGWRGFALPRLQQRSSAFQASLILGVLHMAWHLPYQAMAPSPWSALSPGAFAIGFLIYLIGGIASPTLLITWGFNNTRGSLVFACLYHAAANSSLQTFAMGRGLVGRTGFDLVGVAVAWLAAGVVLAVFGAEHLSRSRSRDTLAASSARGQP